MSRASVLLFLLVIAACSNTVAEYDTQLSHVQELLSEHEQFGADINEHL